MGSLGFSLRYKLGNVMLDLQNWSKNHFDKIIENINFSNIKLENVQENAINSDFG